MLSVIMLSAIVLSVIMLLVVMLNVVAPNYCRLEKWIEPILFENNDY
jgi:hypothetical protein